jgi:hypothetical protein
MGIYKFDDDDDEKNREEEESKVRVEVFHGKVCNKEIIPLLSAFTF